MEFITCREISGIKYSTADTNIKCEDEFFKNNIIPVNLSLIIIFGLFMPISICVMLIKGRKQNKLENIDFKRTFGILYLELKN